MTANARYERHLVTKKPPANTQEHKISPSSVTPRPQGRNVEQHWQQQQQQQLRQQQSRGRQSVLVDSNHLLPW